MVLRSCWTQWATGRLGCKRRNSSAIRPPTEADLAAVPPRAAREAETARLCALAVHMPVALAPGATAAFDRVLLNPWVGLPLFFVAMFGVFEAVYGIAVPLQDAMKWLLDAFKNDVVAKLVAGAPPLLQSFVQDGLVDGVGTVVSFVPLMAVFFGAMAVIEDSGYLSRAAWLMDAAMSRLGLDGRAFVMQLMGFGCNVPALLGTRVMRNRAARLLSMLVIPFSLCSARLQVFLFMTSAVLSPRAAPVALFALYLMSFAAAFLTAFVWKRRFTSHEPLIMELPPYRLPTLGMVASEAWRCDLAFPAPRDRLHRRRRAADLGAHPLSDDRRASRSGRLSPGTSRRGSLRSSRRSASIR